ARNMALDYAYRRIRVNCVCPGFVRTPFIAGILADEERTRRLTALHPLGRLGEPNDIASAVLFLASDESSWITGHEMVVDGGFSVGHPSEIYIYACPSQASQAIGGRNDPSTARTRCFAMRFSWDEKTCGENFRCASR
ncbi:MAG TPA: SDR family oxidoreductase, partial [Bryobacteraceae bacterium]|nr:SDR family oxidoreductase [Bryobacteraceae bacterium]